MIFIIIFIPLKAIGKFYYRTFEVYPFIALFYLKIHMTLPFNVFLYPLADTNLGFQKISMLAYYNF
jgi:hypothetical protein